MACTGILKKKLRNSIWSLSTSRALPPSFSNWAPGWLQLPHFQGHFYLDPCFLNCLSMSLWLCDLTLFLKLVPSQSPSPKSVDSFGFRWPFLDQAWLPCGIKPPSNNLKKQKQKRHITWTGMLRRVSRYCFHFTKGQGPSKPLTVQTAMRSLTFLIAVLDWWKTWWIFITGIFLSFK